MRSHIKMIFALMAIMMIFVSCTQAAQTPDGETETEESQKTESTEVISEVMLSLADVAPSSPEGISDVQLGFNLALLKQLSSTEEGNLFYSSMSINAALTMAYFGADGETQKEIAQVLGYGEMDIQDVAAYQKYLLKSYEDSGDTTFTSANSIWIDDDFSAKSSYINTMKDVFSSRVGNIDLQARDAAGILNSWIDESTNGMIEKLFDEGDKSLADAVMVLMNAIYFNGDWSVPFDPERTSDGQFNGATTTSTVSMMLSNETVRGHEGDDYKSIFMSYGEDERFQMVAVLPDDMNSFLGSLTKDSLKEILSTYEEIDDPFIAIPSFELEQKIELKKTLEALGIKTAFQNNADFSLMSDVGVCIDEVLHKAKIKVDEEGTEAAAVTAVVMRVTGIAMDRFEFVADKPFLFFIVDTENDLVLFTGKVMDLE